MSFDQAIENGALAFFGDKYGDEVRVLKIGGDFSTELCGGTHVTNTSEIEGFIISNETSVSSGVRRIEAMTGSNLIEKSKDALNKLKKLSEMLNVPNEELETRVSDLLKENKKLKSSKKTEKSLSSETLLSESHLVDGKKGEVVVHSNASIEMLRRYADKSVKDAAVSFSILISSDDEKVSYIVTAKQNEKFSAKDLIQLVNTAFNGSGGGRDDFAQGGSQEAGDIENKFNALNINLQSLI
jgi:alanyl-tRNA synthetase